MNPADACRSALFSLIANRLAVSCIADGESGQMGGILPLHERPELVCGIAATLARKGAPEAVECWHRMAKGLLRVEMAFGAEREAAQEQVRLLLQAAIRAVPTAGTPTDRA